MKIAIQTKFINEQDYPKDNRKYYTSNGPKEKLVQALLLSCNGYCMYCGKKIVTESDYRYQIEHSVDKDGNMHQEVDCNDVLMHCKYNLAISCPECNQVCKKAVDKVDLGIVPSLEKCPPKCNKICSNYAALRKDYETKNAIILQPLGNDGLGEHAIIYNLLDHLYEPDDGIDDEEKRFFVQNHIDRFMLNGNRFSKSIIDLCGMIVGLIDSGVKDINDVFDLLVEIKNENIIGENYISFLRSYFLHSSCEKLKDFCSMLVILDAVS